MTRSRRPTSRKGFSFTEVLFAVMILGIGFIMVAAIFPVAIQQARMTSQEGNAAAIARGAVRFIEQNVTSIDMPALGVVGQPGRVTSFRDPQSPRSPATLAPLNSETVKSPTNNPPRWAQADQLWNKVRGNLIVATDTRYGWVPLYRRELMPGSSPGVGVPSPYAQVFIIVAQVRESTSYGPGDVSNPTAGALVNLQARPVRVTVINNQLKFYSANPNYSAAAAEGAYVIIANDPNSGGRMNGRIYRLGNRVEGVADTWDLMPGNDFVVDPGPDGNLNTQGDNITQVGTTGAPANAFIVGRTLLNGTGTPTFAGIAQDVAVYTTFIQMK